MTFKKYYGGYLISNIDVSGEGVDKVYTVAYDVQGEDGIVTEVEEVNLDTFIKNYSERWE